MPREAVRERPILFSGPMIRAILDGRKTQTRRIVKPQPTENTIRFDQMVGGARRFFRTSFGDEVYDERCLRCPYGFTGDRLWVREAFCLAADPITSKTTGHVLYRASDPCDFQDDGDGYPVTNKDGSERSPWRPSIFMPRALSRINLEILSVRVERLQEISGADIAAEGVELPPTTLFPHTNRSSKLRARWEVLWDTINGKRAPWASNPWVWVVEFRRASASSQPEARAGDGGKGEGAGDGK